MNAVQPSLFADPHQTIYHCQRCHGPTPHQILHTYPTGQHMVRCTTCRTGGTTR